ASCPAAAAPLPGRLARLSQPLEPAETLCALSSHQRCLPGPGHDAGHQVCGGGRWSRGQDLPSHQLHHQRFPRRVHPHRVRQLFSQCDGGQQAREPGAVGHGRAGGLRSPPATLLPTDGRLPHLLLPCQPCLL
ncbi:unnamed protein product, partial [Gulo gulo]